MRVLVCTDAVPAQDGSCADAAYMELPGFLPPLPIAQGIQLSGLLFAVFAAAWTWKYLRRFISPKTG